MKLRRVEILDGECSWFWVVCRKIVIGALRHRDYVIEWCLSSSVELRGDFYACTLISSHAEEVRAQTDLGICQCRCFFLHTRC